MPFQFHLKSSMESLIIHDSDNQLTIAGFICSNKISTECVQSNPIHPDRLHRTCNWKVNWLPLCDGDSTQTEFNQNWFHLSLPCKPKCLRGSKSAQRTVVTAMTPCFFKLHLSVAPASRKVTSGQRVCGQSWMLCRFIDVCHFSSSVGNQTRPSMPLVIFKTAGHSCLVFWQQVSLWFPTCLGVEMSGIHRPIDTTLALELTSTKKTSAIHFLICQVRHLPHVSGIQRSINVTATDAGF